MITYHSEKCYRIFVKKKIIFIFARWYPLTYHDAENTTEEPIEFKTFLEAESFINNIAE